MQPAPPGTPWLEYFSQQGGPVQKCLLSSFPFSIGRNDTTDLPINSTRVSREHAVIVRGGNTYRIRDLDSTNGTLVNGQRIDEATLSDGDIVVIADVEFTFFSGLAQAPRKTVTQVIGFRESDSTSLKTQDVVRSLRRLQETVLQGSQSAVRRPVVELATGKPIGVEVSAGCSALGIETPETERSVLAAHPRLGLRLRETFFLLAAEAAQDKSLKLFLRLEIGDLDPGVSEHYLDLLAGTKNLASVVLEFPDSAVNDIAYFHELYRRLKARQVLLCYADFAAGKAQLDVHRKMPPDYLKLSKSFAKAVLKDTDRQAQLQALLSDCRRNGCEVIVPDVEKGPQTQLLNRLGCRYAVGEVTRASNEVQRSADLADAVAARKPHMAAAG
jgi:EAL domain-containing protein (putative c-di-GMP-specific phosphodiesterase class I)